MLLLFVGLVLPQLARALDAETHALERAALCQAMPYREECGGKPLTPPSPAPPPAPSGPEPLRLLLWLPNLDEAHSLLEREKKMHECPGCGMACGCDGDDLERDAPDECCHACDEEEEPLAWD
jgi:hypothetical protein